MDPQTYPTVEIAGEKYEVKFRNYDLIRLKKEHGIDLLSGVTALKGADALEQVGKMLSAGIAHQKALSVEEIINGMDFSKLASYAEAANQALLKVLAQMSPAKPPEPATLQ